MSTSVAPASRALSPRGRSVASATCCLSVFVAGLDATIVNVALPSIQRALGAPVSGLQWAIDAYTPALMTLGGFLFLNTLYLQDVRGYSPLHAGVLTIPMAVALAVFSTVSGRVVAARGPRLALVLAGLLLAGGTGLLIGAGRETATWYLVLAYVLYGAGSGLVSTPITNTALSGLPRDQAGVAGAIASTCRQTGAAIGVAVCGSIVAGSSGGFVVASHIAWALLAGCGAATVLLGLVSTGRWGRTHAERAGRQVSAHAMEVAR